MKIIPLSEGAFTVDHSKKFVPFLKGTDELNTRPLGSLLVEIQPFCIITRQDMLIIDTGLGFSTPDGVLQIHQNLLNKGINPMDVTKVLMSHLHKDHAGGISRQDDLLNKRFISFPNATYHVNRQEWAYAQERDGRSYQKADFELLNNSGQMEFTRDRGTISDYIEYEVTGAHCPYHQVFWIREGGETVFYGGDVAPQLQQMKSRFVAKYDFDGKKAMELRQQWWNRGREENWQMLFYHDINTPVYAFGTST